MEFSNRKIWKFHFFILYLHYKRLKNMSMTRDDRRVDAATNYGYAVAGGCLERSFISKAFLKGAEWADNNPQSGMFNIADAISWLEEHLDKFKTEDGIELIFHNKEYFIEAFKKAMEE